MASRRHALSTHTSDIATAQCIQLGIWKHNGGVCFPLLLNTNALLTLILLIPFLFRTNTLLVLATSNNYSFYSCSIQLPAMISTFSAAMFVCMCECVCVCVNVRVVALEHVFVRVCVRLIVCVCVTQPTFSHLPDPSPTTPLSSSIAATRCSHHQVAAAAVQENYLLREIIRLLSATLLTLATHSLTLSASLFKMATS